VRLFGVRVGRCRQCKATDCVRHPDRAADQRANDRAERVLQPVVIARRVSQCTKNPLGSRAVEVWTDVLRTLSQTHAGSDLLDTIVRFARPAVPTPTERNAATLISCVRFSILL